MLKIKEKNEEGQAIIEFIFFVPLFIFLTLMIYVIGYSINASINQQKVTRGYFYFVTANNSFAPSKTVLKGLSDNVREVALDSIAWQEESENNIPLAGCFPLPTFLGGNKEDSDCYDSSNVTDEKVKMIRLFTAYGMCTATYKIPRGGGPGEFQWMQKFSDGADSPVFHCEKSEG